MVTECQEWRYSNPRAIQPSPYIAIMHNSAIMHSRRAAGKRGSSGSERRDGGAIVHDEFLCYVTAYGICGGQRVGVPLGSYRAPTLALALWWMRDRAAWMAERLDPQPEDPTFPPNSIAPVGSTVPDVPGVLRAWGGDS